MRKVRKEEKQTLYEKYPPSESCSCEICLAYCMRPGWWTVAEAGKAIEAGYAGRMMLVISPDHSFGVLSPAFKGNECNYAMQEFSTQGCTFLKEGLCELYRAGLVPLECRFCHHSRKGSGAKCHNDIEIDWNSEQGKRLIVRWGNITGFWRRQGMVLIER